MGKNYQKPKWSLLPNRWWHQGACEVGADPKIEGILPRFFVEYEMDRHGVKSVIANEFLWVLRGNPGIFDPKEKKISLDPSAPMADVLKCLNQENPGLGITQDEAWRFIFWHECCHADVSKSEWECSYYAKCRLIEMRAEKERFNAQICRAIRNGIGQGVREAFREIGAWRESKWARQDNG